MGEVNLPMHHQAGHTVQRVEYYEIDIDPDNDRNAVFRKFGKQISIGKADAMNRLIENERTRTDGSFPQPNRRPKRRRPLPYSDSSDISIEMNKKTTLYVFKLSDSSGFFFHPGAHPFAFHPHHDHDDEDFHVHVEEFRNIYSDCRLYHLNEENELRVIKPKDPMILDDEHGTPTLWNQDGEVFPMTQWAGFVFNGDLADEEMRGERLSFTMFVVDSDGNPPRGAQAMSGDVQIRHPPAWPSHHNDNY